MKPPKRALFPVLVCWVALSSACLLPAQPSDVVQAKNGLAGDAKLEFVVVVSRHGVRSPTGKTDLLNQYSRNPWPAWSVPPGYLTDHGARLMKLFGAYYRGQFAAEGLLSDGGCTDAEHIRIIADSDQRTRETGKALAAGLAPACALEVSALPEGTPDPLFHTLGAGVGHPDKSLAMAAIAGRIGGNPQSLTQAYRLQLEALETVLHSCRPGSDCTGAAQPVPQSILDIPSSIAIGKGGHLVELRTPLGVASTMAEDMLLEYAEGMDTENVGWGHVNLQTLRDLMQLHTANEDLSTRVRYVAQVESSNLLFHLLQSMEQAVQGGAITGALTKPNDRLLILVGHDTNLANISGVLNLSWILDGRRDDTPPGGALVFELWRSQSTSTRSVRAYYIAQTLDQMRNSTPLSLTQPPQRVPVFLPACGQADGSCRWEAFRQTLREEIDPAFVK